MNSASSSQDRDALFTYETNATSDGRWYFILDENWPEASAEMDCNKKIAMARFSSKGVSNYRQYDVCY